MAVQRCDAVDRLAGWRLMSVPSMRKSGSSTTRSSLLRRVATTTAMNGRTAAAEFAPLDRGTPMGAHRPPQSSSSSKRLHSVVDPSGTLHHHWGHRPREARADSGSTARRPPARSGLARPSISDDGACIDTTTLAVACGMSHPADKCMVASGAWISRCTRCPGSALHGEAC